MCYIITCSAGVSPAFLRDWQDGEMWLEYLEEYPDYLTQGINKWKYSVCKKSRKA
jgi:hypothetical protein